MRFHVYCFLLGSLIIGLELGFSYKTAKKADKTGKQLRNAFLFSAGVALTYLISVQMKQKFLFALFSGIYFCFIDLMLYSLVQYAAAIAHFDLSHGKGLALISAVRAIMCADILIEAGGCFLNYAAIDYTASTFIFPKFEYVIKPLYRGHLVFCYFLIVMFISLIIYRCTKVPTEYRIQYYLAMTSVIVIVGINAVFLYFRKDGMHYTNLDYSIVGYCVAELFLYWTFYSYTTNGMMKKFKNYVFTCIDQGIILYDFDDNMILWNERAKELLPDLKYKRGCKLSELLERYNIEVDIERKMESRTIQCYINTDGKVKPTLCEYRTIENKREKRLGRIFVFTDATPDTDILTGFHSWERFNMYVSEDKHNFEQNSVVSVCDINGLMMINNALGREEGDRLIRRLASEMKKHMPAGSYFVRGPEANLIAISTGHDRSDIITALKHINETIDIDIQFAVEEAQCDSVSIFDTIDKAMSAMKNLKLLNNNSSHSGTLRSLITALQACDNDTEAHVQRTQKMGLELGYRIGLSDLEQSQLSLLCLMHDIGKIGVPLEILNKPGKLTEVEFSVLRSHSIKGYQICKSSPEVAAIADMVLHHHERWDGRGYPDGQSKETIPLLSRIIAVIDAYDAMVSSRIYSPAKPESVAQAELIRCAGTQFDPAIVSEFVRMVQERSFYKGVSADEKNEPVFTLEKTTSDQNTGNVHPIKYASYITDASMRIISVNDTFTQMTGYTGEDIFTQSITQLDLIPPEDRKEYLEMISSGKNANSMAFLEHRLLTKSGIRMYVICYGRDYYDSAAKEMRTQIIVADSLSTFSVRTLVNYEQDKAIRRLEKWEEAYRCDSMTGLLKHEAFKNDVVLQLLNKDIKVLLLMIDVDNFKAFNDTYGHHAGDEFLIAVAHGLKATLRDEDLACRMGGDEFAAALVFRTSVSDEQIYKRAEQIFFEMEKELRKKSDTGTLSMGAVIGYPGDTFNHIYELSDRALYQAKGAGRSRIEFAGKN